MAKAKQQFSEEIDVNPQEIDQTGAGVVEAALPEIKKKVEDVIKQNALDQGKKMIGQQAAKQIAGIQSSQALEDEESALEALNGLGEEDEDEPEESSSLLASTGDGASPPEQQTNNTGKTDQPANAPTKQNEKKAGQPNPPSPEQDGTKKNIPKGNPAANRKGMLDNQSPAPDNGEEPPPIPGSDEEPPPIPGSDEEPPPIPGSDEEPPPIPPDNKKPASDDEGVIFPGDEPPPIPGSDEEPPPLPTDASTNVPKNIPKGNPAANRKGMLNNQSPAPDNGEEPPPIPGSEDEPPPIPTDSSANAPVGQNNAPEGQTTPEGGNAAAAKPAVASGEDGTKKEGEKEPEIPERSGAMQMLNRMRYAPEIKQLMQRSDELTTQLGSLNNKKAKITKEKIDPIQKKLNQTERQLYLLTAQTFVVIILFLVCLVTIILIILFWEFFLEQAVAIPTKWGKVLAEIATQKVALEAAKKEFLKETEDQITNTREEIKKNSTQIRQLTNASLINRV